MSTYGARSIRGAITCDANTVEEITNATQELVRAVISENAVEITDIVNIWFTVSPDLNASFPATAARAIGLEGVPLMCASEIAVPGSLEKCIRMMLTMNSTKSQNEISHVYLRGAKVLRNDLGR